MRQASESARVTLRDIAAELGISVSAVNKALNGHGGVSDELRKKVVETAQRMGYRVNRMAQSMSRNPIRIGIIIPNLWPLFYGAMQRGMAAKLESLADYRITAEYHYLTTLYSKDEIVDGIRRFIDARVDALIICPNFVADYGDWLDELARRRIPVVLVGCDLPNAKRLCCIRHDARLAGQLAAEFMRYILPEGKRPIVFVGNKGMNDHQIKVQGFFDALGTPVDPLADVIETLDDPDVAYVVTRRVLRTRENLGAIYVATSNTVAVCQAVRDEQMEREIPIIGTDIVAEMQPFFEGGLLRGVIFQDPFRQGKLAVETLFDTLTLGKPPEDERLIYPGFVLRSNFPHYLNNIFRGDA